MRSEETTVDGYIKSLPEEKSKVIKAVREVIVNNLPDGIEETMNWGMISYEVPLSTYPDTYNNKPLLFAALASQKNHYAIYLTSVYMDDSKMNKLISAYEKIEKKPNMGKSCIRFTKLENIPIEAIAKIIRESNLNDFITGYETARKK